MSTSARMTKRLAPLLLAACCSCAGGGGAAQLARGDQQTSGVRAQNTVPVPSRTPAVAVAEAGSDGASAARRQDAAGHSRIRRVDFKNFVFPWFPKGQAEYGGGASRVAFRDGRATVPKRAEYEAEIDDVTYSDLTGDGEEEAIVVVRLSLPNRATPDCVFVYGAGDAGQPRLLWQHESGARDAKGFKGVRTEAGALIVEEFDTRESPLCCPRSFVRTRYEWDGGAFRPAEEQTLPNESGSRLP